MKLTCRMLLEKETPGAVRYKEVDDNGKEVKIAVAVIGTLYIRKSALDGSAPQAIKVMVDDGQG